MVSRVDEGLRIKEVDVMEARDKEEKRKNKEDNKSFTLIYYPSTPEEGTIQRRGKELAS